MRKFILEYNPRDSRQMMAYIIANAILHDWGYDEIKDLFYDNRNSWSEQFGNNTGSLGLCSKKEKQTEHHCMDMFMNRTSDQYADLYPEPNAIPNPNRKVKTEDTFELNKSELIIAIHRAIVANRKRAEENKEEKKSKILARWESLFEFLGVDDDKETVTITLK